MELVPGWALYRGLYEISQYAFRAAQQVGGEGQSVQRRLRKLGIWGSSAGRRTLLFCSPVLALPQFLLDPLFFLFCLCLLGGLQDTKGITWSTLGDSNNGLPGVMVIMGLEWIIFMLLAW